MNKKTINIVGEIQYYREVEIEWDDEDPNGFKDACTMAVSEVDNTPSEEWEGPGNNVSSICYSL